MAKKTLTLDLSKMPDNERIRSLAPVLVRQKGQNDKLSSTKKIIIEVDSKLIGDRDAAWITINDEKHNFLGVYSLIADVDNISSWRGINELVRNSKVEITSTGNLEVADLEKIAYVEKIHQGSMEGPYNRKHIDCLFEQLRNITEDEIEELESMIDDDEDGYCHLDEFPSHFFKPESIEGVDEWPVLVPNYIDILLLKRADAFEPGTLTLEPDVRLTKAEQGYLDWLTDKTDKKPDFKIELSDNNVPKKSNLFTDLFEETESKNLNVKF